MNIKKGKPKLSLSLREKAGCYWKLIKGNQTGLLLITGVTGFASARCPVLSWHVLIGLIGSLFLTISGSTILNMIYDRDIDSLMNRTILRPLPSGKLGAPEALIIGLLICTVGVVWACSLSLTYGIIVFAGIFIDVVIYTIWLKRRTAWSIVWGGIAGGMPILAGRFLGLGEFDTIGILLSLSILLWIPTHILTFSISNFKDYARAGIPTFPSSYGNSNTRLIIAVSSILAAISIGLCALALGISWGYLRLLVVLTIGILFLALASITKPSEKINFGLFKYASLYMMGTMIMIALGVLL